MLHGVHAVQYIMEAITWGHMAEQPGRPWSITACKLGIKGAVRDEPCTAHAPGIPSPSSMVSQSHIMQAAVYRIQAMCSMMYSAAE